MARHGDRGGVLKIVQNSVTTFWTTPFRVYMGFLLIPIDILACNLSKYFWNTMQSRTRRAACYRQKARYGIWNFSLVSLCSSSPTARQEAPIYLMFNNEQVQTKENNYMSSCLIDGNAVVKHCNDRVNGTISHLNKFWCCLPEKGWGS